MSHSERSAIVLRRDPRRRSVAAACAAALLAALLAAPACSSSSGASGGPPILGALSDLGRPTFTIRNDATVPVQVTVWTTRHDLDYRATWKDMHGRTDTIDVGEQARFVLRELEDQPRSLVRVEVRTRGVSWEPQRTYWFEALGRNTLAAAITGDADEIDLDARRGTFAHIPPQRVFHDVIDAADRPHTAAGANAGDPAGASGVDR